VGGRGSSPAISADSGHRISDASHGFDKLGLSRVVPQPLPELDNLHIHGACGSPCRIESPDAANQIIPAHHLSSMLQEKIQDAGLRELKFAERPISVDYLARSEIDLNTAELNATGGRFLCWHSLKTLNLSVYIVNWSKGARRRLRLGVPSRLLGPGKWACQRKSEEGDLSHHKERERTEKSEVRSSTRTKGRRRARGGRVISKISDR